MGSICIRKEDELINQKNHQSLQQSNPIQPQITPFEKNSDDVLGLSYDNTKEKSFYLKNAIGPYLPDDKTNSYHKKVGQWKDAIHTTPIHNWKDLESELGIDFKSKYSYCSNKLDKALISYYIMDKQHFIELVKQGAPNNRLRWACWKLMLINDKKIVNYEDSKQEQEELIKKDVKRTLTNHAFFQSTDNGYTIGQEALFKVLTAIAYRIPALGYCQGMNFLAGFFLLISGGNEELTFQCMIQLLTNNKYMMYYMFEDQLRLLQFLEYIAEDQIEQHLPALYKHFYQNLYLPNSFWLTKFFLTIFLYSFKLETCLRLWDYVIANDVFYIVSLMIAILSHYEEPLLALTDVGIIVDWFTQLYHKSLNQSIYRDSENYILPKEKIRALSVKYLKMHPANELVQALSNYPDCKVSKQIMMQ